MSKSKSDMLAPIIRALVGVPPERLGVLLDAVNKVGSADGELWRTRFAEVLREGVKPAILLPEAPLDFIIRVDRSIRPIYPDLVKTVMHLELELTGPAEYNLSIIDSWLHDVQKKGYPMEDNKIYEYLKEQKLLESCLSLRDGEEIRKKGLAVFRKFFGGNDAFLWKSVARDRFGDLCVPYLCGRHCKVVVIWHYLGDRLGDFDSALRFAS